MYGPISDQSDLVQILFAEKASGLQQQMTKPMT